MLDARRRACLEAMGIELWRVRGEGNRLAENAPSHTEPPGQGSETGGGSLAPQRPLPTRTHPDQAPAVANLEPAAPQRATTVLGPEPSGFSWEELEVAVKTCTACDLHETRTQTVFGVGDRSTSLMVVGEAPGSDEDRQGEPFVGRAGQLLNAMLQAIGFAREQVYIANIIKCRPPGNRDPHIEETAACQPFLHRQIALIQPRLILSVGRISAHNLLGTEEAVGRLRGRVHRFDPGDIPLIVTYHPAYLLRRPQEKSKAWQDLQAAYRTLGGRMV